MENVLIIGKSSFLAKNFIKYYSNNINFKLVSYKFAFKEEFKNYTHIISFTHLLKSSKSILKVSENYDVKIAKKLIKENSKAIFIFLSSRKVYKPKSNIFEHSEISPVDIYAKNKLKTEKQIKKIKNLKYLILRISNVIGAPMKRRNKIKNFIDNYALLRKKKLKKIVTNNNFKDFISTKQFSKMLYLLILKKSEGIYNVSLGKKIYVKEIIHLLDKKFYKKFVFLNSRTSDSFYLNNAKLFNEIKYKPSINELKKFIKKIF